MKPIIMAGATAFAALSLVALGMVLQAEWSPPQAQAQTCYLGENADGSCWHPIRHPGYKEPQ